MKIKNVKLRKKDLFKGRRVWVVQGSLYPRDITIESFDGSCLRFKQSNVEKLQGQLVSFDLKAVRPVMYSSYDYVEELALAFFKSLEHALAYRERRYMSRPRLGRDVEFINEDSISYLRDWHALEYYHVPKLTSIYK
ncbi:MAG: hypothetical protein ACRDBQ_18220 [Shewanella sp.]